MSGSKLANFKDRDRSYSTNLLWKSTGLSSSSCCLPASDQSTSPDWGRWSGRWRRVSLGRSVSERWTTAARSQSGGNLRSCYWRLPGGGFSFHQAVEVVQVIVWGQFLLRADTQGFGFQRTSEDGWKKNNNIRSKLRTSWSQRWRASHQVCKEDFPDWLMGSLWCCLPWSLMARSCPKINRHFLEHFLLKTVFPHIHTYNPYPIKGHLLVEPLQVVVPPFVRLLIGEIGKCGQAGPHLSEEPALDARWRRWSSTCCNDSPSQ